MLSTNHHQTIVRTPGAVPQHNQTIVRNPGIGREINHSQTVVRR